MFKLSILTPEKKLVTDQEIDEVLVPGDRGQLDILPGHAPLLTTLQAGVLKYRHKGESNFHSLAVAWGYMQVNPEGVIVLAEMAETAGEVDRSRAEESLRKAQASLAQMTIDPEETERYQRKIELAQARLALLADDKITH